MHKHPRALIIGLVAATLWPAALVGYVLTTDDSTHPAPTVSLRAGEDDPSTPSTTVEPTTTTEAPTTTTAAPTAPETPSVPVPGVDAPPIVVPELPPLPPVEEAPPVTPPRVIVCFAVTRPSLPGQPADPTPVSWACHYEDDPGTSWSSPTDISGPEA